jgi:hypothetical protein
LIIDNNIKKREGKREREKNYIIYLKFYRVERKREGRSFFFFFSSLLFTVGTQHSMMERTLIELSRYIYFDRSRERVIIE